MQQTYSSNHQQRATNAYAVSNYHGRSELELMAEIMGKVIKQLYMAQDAYTNKTLDVMCNHNNKTLHILDVLREELLASDAFNDAESIGPAKFMLHTYNDVMIRLAGILSKPSPKDEYAALVDQLTPVYRAWQAAAPKTTPAPEGLQPTEMASTAV